MLQLIDRYLFREILPPFWLTLGALMIVLLTDQLLRLVELLINKGVSFLVVIKIFFLILPTFLVITIPAAVLMGVIIAFNRLSSDNEIIALQATGIGLIRYLRPALLFSLIAFLVSFALSAWAQPWAGQSVKGLALSLLKQQLSVALEPGVFNEPFDHMVIFIDKIPKPSHLQGIFIHDLTNPEIPVLTLAKEGILYSSDNENKLGFQLLNGTQYRFKEGDPGTHQRVQFASYDFRIDLEQGLGSKDLSLGRLSHAEIKKALIANPSDAPKLRRLLSEYYKNYTFPVSCLVFGILGVPVGLMVKRAGRLGGFAVGLFLGLAYYFLVFISDYLSASGKTPPMIAAWIPNLIMVSIAAFLIIKVNRNNGTLGR